MYIKQVVLDAFKSYANRTVIPDFDREFNAITGLNGTGKSNILDAICFVLGISNLTQIRAGNLQDLIYMRGQGKAQTASVSITFDNTDKSASPVGYEDVDSITITRQVVLDGKSRYLVQGLFMSNTQVHDLFRSVNLNVNNPTFLIMQGKIAKMLDAKPAEILGMIEEAAGTKMYEHKKLAALNTIDKKEVKLQEIEHLLRDNINPTLERLEKDRRNYAEYEDIQKSVASHRQAYLMHVYHETLEAFQKTEATRENVKKKIEALQSSISSEEGEIVRLDKLICEIETKQLLVPRNELNSLMGAMSGLSKSLEVARSDLKMGHDSIKELDKKLRTFEKNLESEKTSLNAQLKSHENRDRTWEALKAERDADQEALQRATLKVENASKGIIAGDETSLRTQLDDAKAKCIELKGMLEQFNITMPPLKAALQRKLEESRRTKNEYERSAVSKQGLEAEIRQIEIKRLEKDSPSLPADYERVRSDPNSTELTSRTAEKIRLELVEYEEKEAALSKIVNVNAIGTLSQTMDKVAACKKKKKTIEQNKKQIREFIDELDQQKNKLLRDAHETVDKSFNEIFSILIPKARAKLVKIEKEGVLKGLEVKVALGNKWLDSLDELSGGQRSLTFLSLILAILLFRPAPLYILDEVDSALDLSHTQNIGTMLKQHFKQSQAERGNLEKGCKVLSYLLKIESEANEAEVLRSSMLKKQHTFGDVSEKYDGKHASTPITHMSRSKTFPVSAISENGHYSNRYPAGAWAEKSSESNPNLIHPQNQERTRDSKNLNQAILQFCAGFDCSQFKFQFKSSDLIFNADLDVEPFEASVLNDLAKVASHHRSIQELVKSTMEGSESKTRQALATVCFRQLQQYYNSLRILNAPLAANDSDEKKLIRLTYCLEPVGDKLRAIWEMLSYCGPVKGGILLSKMYECMQTGDEPVRRLFYGMLTSVCVPIHEMIYKWLSEGKISDNYEEFFIGEDSGVDYVDLGKWWHKKYFIRNPQVPVFLDKSIAEEILAVGKNVIFTVEICRHDGGIPGLINLLDQLKSEVKPESLLLEGMGESTVVRDVQGNLYQKEGDYLGTIIHNLFTLTSSYVYHDLVLKEYGLLNELTVLRQFLLLGHGDFAKSLMSALRNILDKPAVEINNGNLLRGPLKFVIRELFGTQGKLGVDRLDVKTFEGSVHETGWDTFVLNYRIEGPLGAVITPGHVTRYSQLFRCLWRIQRTSYIAGKLWMELKNVWKYCVVIPEMMTAAREIMSLIAAMLHMSKELHFFLSFEVIECEWRQMMEKIKTADSLDAVANIHERFLCEVLSRNFLKDTNTGVFPRVRKLQNLVLKLDPIVRQFFDAIVGEYTRRVNLVSGIKPKVPPKNFAGKVVGRPLKGRTLNPPPKIPSPLRLSESETRHRLGFGSVFVEPTRHKVKTLRIEFTAQMCDFLLELSHDVGSLLPLSTRLDFNEFYRRTDKRLGTPLTYRHQREMISVKPGAMPKTLFRAGDDL
ncbi:unnamed protein product [Notodromas monacha]|uniref:Structural maintenance of chromosomes protein 2 n=1 Tax=Notodromas monacha TaxID=399045 RepID=A0A7R9BVG2_9CRUS|nr:unnamed protein product [Notodromas monacha]CAG0922481.1 unnamed protein product [Notodromas monacha]